MNRILCALVALTLLLCCCGCGDAPSTHTATALDTVCSVTVYAPADDAAASACLQTLKEDEQRWSRTVTTSDIARLNDLGCATVDEATVGLLTDALAWSDRTDGAFDITSASLTDLWKAAEQTNTLPSSHAIETALNTVGAGRITVDGTTVTLAPGTAIDLGAIAKGAIADRLADQLRQSGCDSALIDLGGNIVAVGTRPDGKPFRVGIVDPQNPESLITTVLASDSAVVTSGSYERGYTIGGRRYSHILDPHTGYPVDNDLLSATILAPSAADADALSTACFVMGYEKAAALIDSIDGIEAVFVLRDGRLCATEGVLFAD